ncbi:MAG: hypothetical protein XU15_C0011G0029 [candidate division NC10 bacterium CSP1-5]|nr:MAG: hypothetical protein XU15_C0011G0029 [candidate division NC10 bacterium CSP1-5]
MARNSYPQDREAGSRIAWFLNNIYHDNMLIVAGGHFQPYADQLVREGVIEMETLDNGLVRLSLVLPGEEDQTPPWDEITEEAY